jgi:hypothetical protein
MSSALRRPPRWSKKTDLLVAYVALRCRPGLQLELGRWIESSPRFGAFLVANQDKVRKKLTTSDDEEHRLDVRAELLVAALLVADRRFEVAFEAYGARRLGPDLTVTFRANQRFNLEVTRLRTAPDAGETSSELVSSAQPSSGPGSRAGASGVQPSSAADSGVSGSGVRPSSGIGGGVVASGLGQLSGTDSGPVASEVQPSSAADTEVLASGLQRSSGAEAAGVQPSSAGDSEVAAAGVRRFEETGGGAQVARLANVIAGKVRQLPGESPNALVMAARGLSPTEDRLVAALRLLKLHTDRKDDAFFARRGFKDAGDFHARSLRLSGVFVLDEAARLPRAIFAANREARHPLANEVVSLLIQRLSSVPGVQPGP